MQNFEKLPMYIESQRLVDAIYSLTRGFPKEEIYGITSQLRRAAVSIVCNIAEGQGRKTRKDHRQFLLISRGSIYEVLAILKICLNQNMISDKDYFEIREKIELLIPQVNGMINYLDKR